MGTASGVETRSRKRARVEVDGDSIPFRVMRRIEQFVADGAARKGLDALLSTGSHDPTDPTIKRKLRDLHPQRPPPTMTGLPHVLDPSLGDSDPGFWEDAVRDAILRFPRASAPGPSGLRPSHLQDAVRRRGRGLTLIAALASLTQLWVHGRLPPEHAPFLCGANLTPLRKKDDGVRPVAVGETIRRLVGKALLSTATLKQQVAALAPLQCGVGVRGATEAVAMGTQCLVNQFGGTGHWALLKVDLSNAFNSVHREHILKGALHSCPGAYNFLAFAYAQHAPLYLGEDILTSEEGTHQGCPLGPLGFALGIHDLLETAAKDSGLVWSTWYLDDGMMLGAPDRISRTLTALRSQLEARGLRVNLTKCEVWGPAGPQVTALFPDVHLVPWTPDSGITVLGIPVSYPGTHHEHIRHWSKATTSLLEATEKVTKVVDAQTAHHLLRHCLDACKVNHLLRASDCYVVDDVVKQVSDAILSAFEDIIGCSLTPEQRAQAALPLSVGGCGLRCPLAVRPAARLSALATFYSDTAQLVGVPDYARTVQCALTTDPLTEVAATMGPNFDPITRWQGNPGLLATADSTHRQQRWWSEQLGARRMHSLLDNSAPRDQARLLEQVGGLGSCFMGITPSRHLNSVIPTDTYRLALRWWLGCPLMHYDPASPPKCPGCLSDVDPHGDHLLCCIRNNYTARHQAMQEALAQLLTDAGQPFEREVTLPNASDAQLRPADILLRSWQSGKDTAVDITVVHGWQATVRSAAVTREKWRTFLTHKETQKVTKYAAACHHAGWTFLPMAFGTWGGLGPQAAKLAYRLLKRAASWADGDLRAARQEELRLGLGLSLMRHVWLLLEAKNLLQ